MVSWLDATLNEHYELIRVLKKNETSEILVLRHKTFKRDIVKRIFQGESEIYHALQYIKHPNIPVVYEVVSRDSSVIVLEEYIDGITLSEELKVRVFAETETRNIIRSVCEALFALHHLGIIHRDVKPENIMINNGGVVKLIDYNAAKLYKTYKSNDTYVIGTTGFAAPEQFGISQSNDKTDIFSLGIMMNVMLTGSHPSVEPYKGKLSRIIDKCTQIDPKKRYHNVLSLAKDLL